jgi:hypothetical protein
VAGGHGEDKRQTRHAFFRENLKLRAEVEELEHKSATDLDTAMGAWT